MQIQIIVIFFNRLGTLASDVYWQLLISCLFTLLRSDSAGKITILRWLDLDLTWPITGLDLTWLAQEKNTWDLLETWRLRLETYLRLAHVWLSPISDIYCVEEYSRRVGISWNNILEAFFPCCLDSLLIINKTASEYIIWDL